MTKEEEIWKKVVNHKMNQATSIIQLARNFHDAYKDVHRPVQNW